MLTEQLQGVYKMCNIQSVLYMVNIVRVEKTMQNMGSLYYIKAH